MTKHYLTILCASILTAITAMTYIFVTHGIDSAAYYEVDKWRNLD